jgi:hypothetical protein
MTQNRSLDNIIKKVPSSYQARGSNEEKFSIHKNRRELVSTPWPWQSVDYYLVSFASFAECKNLSYRMSDFASGGFVDLSIDYRVSCDRENAKQVVLALYGNSPLEELEGKIKVWIAKYTEGNTHHYVSDINACFSSIWQIQQNLAQKVIAEIGLNFESKISIVNVSNLRPFSIETNELSYLMSDFSSNKSLDITIDYRATCDSSNISQAVSALYGNVSPINVLNEKVKSWIAEFSGNRTAQIIDNFDIEIGNLRANLRERARKEVGLNFEARISSNFQQVHRVDLEQVKPFETELISLPIRIRDYDQELELHFEAILDVDPENQDKAFRNRGREFLILTTIKEEAKKYFLLNVNLHKFCTDLQYSIRQELETSLNLTLAEKGRKLSYLSLSSNSIEEIIKRLGLIPFLEIKDYQIECPLQDLKKPIRVNNSISLQLVDLSLYRTAVANRLIPLDEYHGKPNLEKWAKRRLEQEVNSILPHETFSNLLLEFEPIVSEEIKDTSSVVTTDKINARKYSDKIFTAFSNAVTEIGYIVTRLISEPDLDVRETLALDKFEFLVINDYFISCTVKGYAKPIQVKNNLNLQIIDVWKYSNAVKTKQIPLDDIEGKPNLDKWAKQKLDKIVQILLLKTEYVALLQEENTESFTSDVQEEIQRVASAIGYEVTQIISIPELEQVRALRENFSVKTGEREYPTKDPNCPVKLDATVVTRIENLQEIGNRLRISEVSLPEQISNKIYETISRILNGIEPERFFMGFDAFDAKIRGETKSVEEELKEAIRRELEENFKAVVISSTLKIVDTDLMKLCSSLFGGTSDFKIDFQPTSGDVEKVIFTGKFQVLSVGQNDWNKFQIKFRNALNKRPHLLEVIGELEQERMQLEKLSVINFNEINGLIERLKYLQDEACGIDLIRENIKSDFVRIVRRYKGVEFKNSKINDLNRLENELNQWLKEGRGSIRDLYGLVVEVSQTDCPVTESEESKAEKQYAINAVKRRRELTEKRIEKLEGQLLELTGQTGVDDEIEKIEDSLEKLYEQLQNRSSQIDDEHKKLNESSSTETNTTFRLGEGLPTQRNLFQVNQEPSSKTEPTQSPHHSSNLEDETEPSVRTVDVEVVDDDSSTQQ